MIKLIENFNDYDFSLFENDVFFQRIKSEYNVSSSFSDALFYVSISDFGVNAVISKVSGNVTLSALENAPFEELCEFISVIGYAVILCDENYSSHFNGDKTQGYILKAKAGSFEDCKAKLLYSENLKDMFMLLKEVFSLDNDYMFWVTDLSHKIRHNSATACGILKNNKLVSVGFSLFETSVSAVISSVATDESFRSEGLGGEVVKKLLSINEGKDVYVFIENEMLKSWYKKFGFAEYKKWSEIKNVL